MATSDDLLMKVKPLFSTQLEAPIAAGASDITLADGSGLDDGTAVILTIDYKDEKGNLQPAKRDVKTGVVNGTRITNVSTVEGADQAHDAGAVVEMYLTAEHWNRMVSALLKVFTSSGEIKQSFLTEQAISNNSVTSNKVKDGSVIPNKLLEGAPNTWDWQDFTPVFSGSGLVMGNATIDEARYCQVGKVVHFKLHITVGTTTTIDDLHFTLPVKAKSARRYVIGDTHYNNNDSVDHDGVVWSDGVDKARAIVNNSDLQFSRSNSLHPTVPFTWAANDWISIAGTYEAE